jgi:UPF0716 protein FxsA
MMSRLFLGYAVVELAALVALVSTIGFGWTVLLLLAAFLVGLAVAGSQLKRQLMRLRSGLTTTRDAVSDGALVALGTVLVVIPGLVTTAAGLLLLLPLTRPAARPVVAAIALRGIGRPLITANRQRRDVVDGFIDGEVIDVTDVEAPALPRDTE